MPDPRRLQEEHKEMTRRYFLGLGAAGVAGLSLVRDTAMASGSSALLDEAVANLEYLTRDEDTKLWAGQTSPLSTLPERLREVGLDRETWQLEVLPDPESDSKVERPLSKELGTALNWSDLMKLAEEHAVRFLHVLSCTNVQPPCGMGLWEGVPMREVVWMAKPTSNVRRLFYYGYHNDDPNQRFQSSLPIERVLEDAPGELPVILCYRFNDRWLSPARGGPVRVVVPGFYGNKSVKWLQRILLTNEIRLNDTYAEWNNDTESHLKTCARFIQVPETVKAGTPIPITGLAQVGMSGLSKVQYWLHPENVPLSEDDPNFTHGDWVDAEILPPPVDWGGGLPSGNLPPTPSQIDSANGRPYTWPIPNTTVHWAALLTDVSPGRYALRCRTIDAAGFAQPMPRPFPKSGNNAIQRVELLVEEV